MSGTLGNTTSSQRCISCSVLSEQAVNYISAHLSGFDVDTPSLRSIITINRLKELNTISVIPHCAFHLQVKGIRATTSWPPMQDGGVDADN